MKYWLMKSEPGTYSIEDLERQGVTPWEGVRNYQARNFMRDDMRVGDLVLFYHSNAKPPGAAGVGRVCREAHPDHFAQDRSSAYYDPKATEENPIWMMVDVEFVERFPSVVALADLKSDAKLEGMMLLKKGVRLSVQPVSREHFDRVCALGRRG